MPNKSERQALRAQRTRDQVVQAALTVFALKGYTAASMDDVALAAGCSKGGLYHHFPQKSAVLTAVVERLIRIDALLPPFTATTGESALPAAAFGRVLVEIWAEAGRSEELRAQLRAGYEACLDRTLMDRSRPGSGLAEILRIGTLIQLLTRNDPASASEAAVRLGIAA
ncbi:MAG: helix-turn-helix transcriptional regulator [Dehalococcoidia bacterium]|nr:helix-turn-helix transcriptional regulator [Dehalococcoidia bacterium]